MGGHDLAGHPHGIPALPRRADPRPLAAALAITAGFVLVEAVGGVLSGSLALLADAGHMGTDAAALTLSLSAIWLRRRPATPRRSFGFARAEVLAALVNAATLVAVSVLLFWEVGRRLGDPPEVAGGPMLLVAVAGLVANGAAWVLMRGGGHQLEATPPAIDPTALRRAMATVPGVGGGHDRHVGTVTSGLLALSAHVAVANRPRPKMLTDLTDMLRAEFGIGHATLQPEPLVPGVDPFAGCTLETPEGLAICRAGRPTGAVA